MAKTNINILWSDANGDSITKYKFTYSNDNGATWIESVPKSIIPTNVSPITVPFDITELGLKSGEYLIKVLIFDGQLWSEESTELSLRVSSYVDTISRESDLLDKSETITFTVKSASTQQQVRVTPSVNYIAGFKAELYKGLLKLQTLEWSVGNLQSKVFVFTPTTNDEEYKIKIIPNLPSGSGNNIIVSNLRLLNDTNNVDFAIVNIQRNNPDYNEIIDNKLFLTKENGIDYIKAQYEVASELSVELTNIMTSEVVIHTMLINTKEVTLLSIDSDDYNISAITPEDDVTYTYSF